MFRIEWSSIMNWQGHKQLYEPLNLAKMFFIATEKWKDHKPIFKRFKKNRQPKLELIDGDKE
jgi:hypothetical protein